jgi:amino acid adenylation domain-containing protein
MALGVEKQPAVQGFRLSPQQRRLCRLAGGIPAAPYRAQGIVSIDGNLDPGALAAALAAVVERHEILRTRLCRLDLLVEPVQVIGPPEAPLLPRPPDWSGVAAEQAAARLEALAEVGDPNPFDAGDLPLEASLVQLGATRHLLRLRLPAFCLDAAGLELLTAEIARTYAALREGRPPAAEPLQYADLAEWQNELLESESMEEARAFWRELPLAGRPGLAGPQLPFEGPAPEVYEPRHLAVPLDPDLTRRVAALDGHLGVPLEAWLLATWRALLARLVEDRDLVVGVACDGRRYEELGEAIGPFERCLPLPGDAPQPRESLRDLAERTARAWETVRKHQEYFAWELLLGAGAEGRPPALAYVFRWDSRRLPTEAGGLRWALARERVVADRHRLGLACRGGAGALELELRYDSGALAEEHVERLAERLLALLADAASRPESPWADMESVGRDEQRMLLGLAAGPHSPLLHGTAQEMFEEQARRTPAATAAIAGDRCWTYAELDEQANRWARHLRTLGVAPEARVGICLERSLDLLAAVLGVLKAGGAYVPLDPSYPGERLAFVLEDAAAEVLIAPERLAARIAQRPGRLVDPEVDRERIAAMSPEPLARVTGPDHLAYLIYTSGSTGRPKGVMVPHRGLVNYLDWCRRTYLPEGGGGAPVHSSLGFDLTVTALLAPLTAGQPVVLLPEEASVQGLAAALRGRPGFAFVKLTPAHIEVLNRLLPAAEAAGATRALVVGGEPLAGAALAFWREHCPGVRLFNEYGPTEAVVGCVVHEAEPPDGAGQVPIGRPIPNARVHLLDGGPRPAPFGVAGELCIGGVGLARGYQARPDLTAERFVPDPSGTEPGGRLYRTGDLARYRGDGTLEFLGRTDGQLKIRGFRVEPGEIEAVLRQHPGVAQAAVVPRADGAGGRLLVAYVAPADGESPTTQTLRALLEERLPDYMVPARVTILPKLPLTPHGKVDREALPEPEGPAYVVPRTMEEEVLAAVWGRVLGASRVGIDDDYFALGGDSIRSIQVVSQARERGLSFSMEDLFRHRTIRTLAAALAPASGGAEPEAAAPFSLIASTDRRRIPEGIEDAYPLAAMQAGMIYHREADPDAAVYHDISCFELRVPLHLPTLGRAVAALVARHPILRTCFDLTAFAEPLQLVHRGGGMPLEVVDLRRLPTPAQQGELAAWKAEEKRRGFAPDRLPLLRFVVHRRTDETFQFALSFHHAVLDGWSDATMLTELALSYAALGSGEAIPFQPPRTRYRDFVALERTALAAEEPRRFWDEALQDRPFTRLPRWRPPLARVRGEQGVGMLDVAISPALGEGLLGLARSLAVPIKSVLLAAHLRAISLLSGQEDVLTCLTSSGRPDTVDGERVLGLFLNNVPVRLRLTRESWADLARRCFEAERRALPFRRFPMAELQRRSGGGRLSETFFYFTHYHVHLDLRRFADLEVLGHEVYEETDYALAAVFLQDPFDAHLSFRLIYDRNELPAAQAGAIAGIYQRILEAMVEGAERSVDTLPPLSPAEGHQLLREWNDTRAPVPAAPTLHEEFRRQAARTPGAVAVSCAGESLTYEELDRRSDRAASRLAALGVGPEILVGVCLQRSLDLPAALLGVLKAGGAYLPLDPSYPRARLLSFLEDSGAPLLLAEGSLRELFPGFAGRLVLLEEVLAGTLRGAPIGAEATGRNAAYVLYTSGSTGRPKGVVVPHCALMNFLGSMAERPGHSASDVLLAVTSLSFDISGLEIYLPLLTGARVEVTSPEVAADGAALAEALERCGATVMQATPSTWRLLLESGWQGDERLTALCGGEALPADLARQLASRCAVLWNLYGPTETTIWSAVQRIEPGTASVSLGGPIANTEIHVLDEHLRPVRVGAAGELLIGGGGLARAYLGRPDQTAERFVPDPFGGRGARLYRTGDLARRRPDGAIEFLGRLDHQVKVRGHRIELGEIETALARIPGVGAAVVAAREVAPEDVRLVGYAVPEPGAVIEPSALRATLLAELPSFMVPSAVMVLETFPLTPNGKLDRRALPAPEASPERGYVAPRDPVEDVLAGMWAEALGLDRVGVHDDFFALGGHSLLATRLIAQIRAAFRVELRLQRLLREPTPAALAAGLREEGGDPRRIEQTAILLLQLADLSDREVEERLIERP